MYLPRVPPGKWTRSKKRVLNDEYNTHYLDLLVSGYAIAQSSGDKKAANEWLKAVTTYNEKFIVRKGA